MVLWWEIVVLFVGSGGWGDCGFYSGDIIIVCVLVWGGRIGCWEVNILLDRGLFGIG